MIGRQSGSLPRQFAFAILAALAWPGAMAPIHAANVAPATAPAATEPPADATAPAAPVDPKVLALLDMLQNRDATLHDFTATVHTSTTHSRTDETETRKGTVAYVKGNPAKFAIHFSQSGVDDEFNPIDQDLVFDGSDLIDRNNAKKQFKLIHLTSPGKHINPLKLGEGPLPLPIGQSSAEILRQFVVTLVDEDAATHISHLKLIPRHAGVFDFTQLDLWVDTALQLPTKMQTIAADGDPTTIVLKNVQINRGTDPNAATFSVIPPPGWSDVDISDSPAH